jgi:hypothetical protein
MLQPKASAAATNKVRSVFMVNGLVAAFRIGAI